MSLRYAMAAVTRHENALAKQVKALESMAKQPKDQIKKVKRRIGEHIKTAANLKDALDKSIEKLMATIDKIGELANDDNVKIDNKIDTVNKVLEKMQEVMLDIETNINDSFEEEEEEEEQYERQYEEGDQSQRRAESENSTNNMPRIQVPKFTGNRWDWENFWTIFEEMIDKSSCSDLMKFNHLMNFLQGEPKELLRRFKMCKENYRPAIELLKKRYDDKETTISELTSKLANEKKESNSITDQRKLFDRIFVIMEQLKQMGESIDSRMHKEMVIEKFTTEIQEEVFKKKMNLASQSEWTMEKICRDLDEKIARDEELARLLKKNLDEKPKNTSSESKSIKSHHHQSNRNQNEAKAQKCMICDEAGHYGNECQKFQTPSQKWEAVKKSGKCLNCLRPNHSVQDCKSKLNCKKCNLRHNTLLCQKSQGNTNSPVQPSNNYRSNQSNRTNFQNGQQQTPNGNQSNQNVYGGARTGMQATVVTHPMAEEYRIPSSEYVHEANSIRQFASNQNRRSGHLPTVKAVALNPAANSWQEITIMIDSGADQTYVKSNIMKSWNLPSKGCKTIQLQTFGQTQPSPKSVESTSISLRVNGQILELEALTANHLTGRIQKATLTTEDIHFAEENGIIFNGGVYCEQVDPDVIIGCDHLCDIWNGTPIALPSGIHVIRTVFGYTTIGKFRKPEVKSDANQDTPIMVSNIAMTWEETLEVEQRQENTLAIEKGESTGSLTTEKAEINAEVWRKFEETIEKRENGYYVRLPFKDNFKSLPDNYAIAIKRLRSVLRYSSKEVLEQVDSVFKDQVEKRILEEVDERIQTTNLIHYNPHQPVITPHKTTTKCRVVIDGSSHFKNEMSLNEVIHQGPVILPQLVHMLLRFRAGATAILADVEKAFLMVHLHEDDRDATRLLWIRDIHKPANSENIVMYRFTRVLFGLNVSPFLLAATILHHLNQYPNKMLAKEIAENIYVDNLILTTDEDPSKAVEIYKETKQLFNGMQMNLREFVSNNHSFNEAVNEKDRAEVKELKVLGIKWNPLSDNLKMECQIPERDEWTRRSVASTIHSIYDPLGFLEPLLLPLKQLQSKLWNVNYEWDTPLNQEHRTEWEAAIREANSFQITLPRHVIAKSEVNRIVTFTDASNKAASCCTYAVVNGKIKTFDGTEVKLFEAICKAESLCQAIDCILCWNNLLNPECSPNMAVLGIGMLLYVILLICYCGFRVPVHICGPCEYVFYGIKLTIRIIMWIITKLLCCPKRKIADINWRRRNIPIRLTILTIGMQIMFLTAEGCQEIDLWSQNQTICSSEDGKQEECLIQTNEFVSLNSITREGCLRLSKNGTTIKEIRIRLDSISLECQKETVVHTKQVIQEVLSAKRCPHMGSCVGNKCMDINRTSMVPELEQANKHVGVTSCVESCGGVGCDCFYPSSGCLFYRIFAKPLDSTIYEIFRCQSWSESISLSWRSTKLNSYKNHQKNRKIKLKINTPMKIDNMTLTTTMIHTPQSPILSKWFITNGNSTALWEQERFPAFRCLSRKQAERDDCTLVEQCQCNPAENTIICTCHDDDIMADFKSTNLVLPVLTNHWTIEKDNEKVSALIERDISIQISIKIAEPVKTTIVKTTDHCTIRDTHAIGCYNCGAGAKVQVKCKSDRREVMADVNCQSELFTVECTPDGKVSTLQFFTANAKFYRNCSVQCGGKRKEMFEITGILKFSGSIWTSIYRIIHGESNIFDEIAWPDIQHIWEIYCRSMMKIWIVVAITATIFLLTYSIVTNASSQVLKFSLRMIAKLLYSPFIFIYWIYTRLKKQKQSKLQRYTV